MEGPSAIAVLAAVRTELAPTAARLGIRLGRNSGEGTYRGRRVLLRLTGVGAQRAEAAMARLWGQAPQLVISAGFAGGLDPALRVGEVLSFGSIVSASGDSIPLSAAPDEPRLLSTDAVVTTVAEKRTLFERYGAQAVDMETFVLARFCRTQRTRFCALRAISDPADTALPSRIGCWIRRSDGQPSSLLVASDVVSHPTQIPALYRLARNARLAAERLADALLQQLDAEIA